MAFTEQGSNAVECPQQRESVLVNIAIMRAFVQCERSSRPMPALLSIGGTREEVRCQFRVVFDAIGN